MKYLYLIPAIALFALSLSLSSCKNTLDSPTGQSDIVFPDSNVSYSKQVQPLFNIECNYSGCHDSQTASGSLDLTDYFSLINAPGVVIAKDTVHSILIQRIEGKGPTMPPSPASPLTPNQIKGLKTWVMEGLKYN
jgi:hypothetical protein